MVGEDGHDRRVEEPCCAQTVDEPAHLRVHVRDLAVVGRLREPGAERLRRVVGIVRVVEVDPQEERSRRPFRQPGQRAGHDLAAASLHRRVAVFLTALDLEARVVRVEPAVEAGGEAAARVQDQRAYEGGGAVALRTQQVGEPRHVGGQRHAEVVHAMELRIGADEDGSVRDRGDGGLGERLLEHRAIAREGVERGREPARRAEEAHAVGPGRVEGDEHDVRLLRRRGGKGGEAEEEEDPVPHEEQKEEGEFTRLPLATADGAD